MNASDYRNWIERAFLYLEGSLLQRAAEDSPSRVTEDFVRQSLVDGLKAAKPALANSVKTEVNVPWNRAPDVRVATATFGSGRPRQHDIGVKENNIVTLVCEAKWLKSSDPETVMDDLWKLALTHGAPARERDACRTFLLVGGLKAEFQNTLQALHRKKVALRWSPQGKARQFPKPTRIKFNSIQRKKWGFARLVAVIKRRDSYHRQPPTIWREMRCSVRARSWKTIRESEWKIALWELDFHAPCRRTQLTWGGLRNRL